MNCRAGDKRQSYCLHRAESLVQQKADLLLSDTCLSVAVFTSCFLWAFRSWLYDLCRGIEDEPVKNRYLPQSIGCSKNFPGRIALATQKEVGEAYV